MENQFNIFVIVRFIRISSCIRCQLSEKPGGVQLAWKRMSCQVETQDLKFPSAGVRSWSPTFSSYLPGQSSVILSPSYAPASFQFLEIHKNLRPRRASLKCFQLEDRSGRQRASPSHYYCNHSPSPSTALTALQLVARLMLLLGSSRS